MDKKIIIGLVADADAGKTTLTESLLFRSGTIRNQGRVDHRDAFLDTFRMEKERGITIFSKTAVMDLENTHVTIVDTPGHGDFSSEMERTLWVLDYAVLLISQSDGITGQCRLLWNLLRTYGVPTIIFVNKTDRPDFDKENSFKEIRNTFGSSCIDFSAGTDDENVLEELALSDQDLLDKHLNGESITDQDIKRLLGEEKIFPVLFGSGLKNTGTDELLSIIDRYTEEKESEDETSAKIYKISRDEKGNRLTWIKLTGGTLKVKDTIVTNRDDEVFEEKCEQLRIYSGNSFKAVSEIAQGDVAAVLGLEHTFAGQGTGREASIDSSILEPMLSYEVQLPDDISIIAAADALRVLTEEEPGLGSSYDEETRKCTVRVMGKLQSEILKNQVKERFGFEIELTDPSVIYKETIASPVEGVGHFEPLRHYAEVHLLIEPGDIGSGISVDSICSTDELALNWQRLILTHLTEKQFRGVLTGSLLTDVRITLIAGKAHPKHTEGGDFRQATYRAVRQGLMEAVSVLLEPYYDFVITVPEDRTGRVLNDLSQMDAKIFLTEASEGKSEISGRAPAVNIGNYQEKLSALAGGMGHISLTYSAYYPCHNTEEVIENRGYDPESDRRNPSASVFCSHGAGLIVPWYEVKERMHVESPLKKMQDIDVDPPEVKPSVPSGSGAWKSVSGDELDEIFKRTFSANAKKRDNAKWKKRFDARQEALKAAVSSGKVKARKPENSYLLVDGYNIIYAWDDLKELMKIDLGAARDRLMDMLCDYQGLRSGELILVFDAYKVAGGKEKIFKYNNIHVVYTQEAETADQYIEKTVHKLAKNNEITVATSDGLEQIIAFGGGAVRMSARDLRADFENLKKKASDEWIK